MGAGVQRNMLRFVKANHGVISSVADKDIFFPVILAIASDESGYGTSDAAKYRNNFFGIENGDKKFSSPQEAFAYQADLFYKKPYTQNNVTAATTPYEQLRRIADSGYYAVQNDFSIPKDQRYLYKNWTAQQSADKYYNELKPFIDDALTAIPVGKITSNNLQQTLASI